MLGLLVTQQQYNTAVGIEVAKALSELAMKKQRIVPQMDSEVHQFNTFQRNALVKKKPLCGLKNLTGE